MRATKFLIAAIAVLMVSSGAMATSITVQPNPNRRPPAVPAPKAPPKRPPAKKPPAPIVQPPAPQRSATDLNEEIKTIDDALSKVEGELDGRFFYSFKIAPKSVSAMQTVESCNKSGIDMAKLNALLPDASKPISGTITLQRDVRDFPGSLVIASPAEIKKGLLERNDPKSPATLHALGVLSPKPDSPEGLAEKIYVEFRAILNGIKPSDTNDFKKLDPSYVLSDAKVTVYAFAKKDDDAPSCVLIATLIPGQTISLSPDRKPDPPVTPRHDVKTDPAASPTNNEPAKEPIDPDALAKKRKNVRTPAEPTTPPATPATTGATQQPAAAAAAPTAAVQAPVLKAMSGPGGGCAVDGSQGWLLVMTAFGLISIRRRRVS